eukprot:scaffold31813_cov62-Phaeocystis_antarctica.AAC.6
MPSMSPTRSQCVKPLRALRSARACSARLCSRCVSSSLCAFSSRAAISSTVLSLRASHPYRLLVPSLYAPPPPRPLHRLQGRLTVY